MIFGLPSEKSMNRYTLLQFERRPKKTLKWGDNNTTDNHTWWLKILESNIFLLRLRIKEYQVVCYTRTYHQKQVQIESQWGKIIGQRQKRISDIIDEAECFIDQ